MRLRARLKPRAANHRHFTSRCKSLICVRSSSPSETKRIPRSNTSRPNGNSRTNGKRNLAMLCDFLSQGAEARVFLIFVMNAKLRLHPTCVISEPPLKDPSSSGADSSRQEQPLGMTKGEFFAGVGIPRRSAPRNDKS